ncbi:MAG TPA: CHASE3 domain-containing protein, partial [Mycobacterium sp.]
MSTAVHPLHRAKLTVRGWLALTLFGMGVLVLAGAVVGAALLNRTDAVSRLLSQDIQPARVAAAQLQASLRDQETGIRGYLISADRQFLTPYYDGQQAEHAAAEDIRRLVGGRMEMIADLDAIERAATAWRSTYAEPLIASVSPNSPTVVSGEVADRGKAEFDHLRGLFDTQNVDFATASARAAEELNNINGWRDRVLGAIVLLFFGMAILLGFLTRAAITIPLTTLAASCRRITDGNFAETISIQRRPRDIHAMAIEVEKMRKRL